MYVEVESALSIAQYALRAAADGDGELAAVAPLAKAACSDAYVRVATETIQLLGGIGVTWEHPAHLYFRRAKGTQLLFGDRSWALSNSDHCPVGGPELFLGHLVRRDGP
jgi:alkylation response protein AidB-like acyl-CoA dehydrogenase